MHIKETYVIFIHLFDSEILLIIDLKGHYLPNRKLLLLVIDTLIKRVSITYKCYEMYAHRGKIVQLLVF